MKLDVEVCDLWDGVRDVCDPKRKTCAKVLAGCGGECLHKPFVVNGRRLTVKEAIMVLLKQVYL